MDFDSTLALFKLKRAAGQNAGAGCTGSRMGGSENISIAGRQSIHHDRRHSNVSLAKKQQSKSTAISGGPVNRAGRNSFPLFYKFKRFLLMASTGFFPIGMQEIIQEMMDVTPFGLSAFLPKIEVKEFGLVLSCRCKDFETQRH
jgi:hypothetical protein